MTDSPSRGEAFKNAVQGEFDLGPDESEILTECAVMLDRLDLLDEAVRRDGVVLAGGKIHPAAVESRQVSIALRQHLHALGLPDEAGDNVRTRSATAAAQARWAVRGTG